MGADNPVDDLAELLAATSALSSHGVRVYAWAPAQARETSLPRIVIFPQISDGEPAANVPEAIVDENVRMVASLWAGSGGAGWRLKSWFLQALDEQAQGAEGACPGYWWSRKYQVIWPRTEDTTLQGQHIEIVFTVRFAAAEYPAEGEGLVESTSIDGTVS